jgi:hypothetical protein
MAVTSMAKSSINGLGKINHADSTERALVTATTGSPATTTDGNATIYSFTGSGSITVSRAGFVELLVLGGGGSGGLGYGGGGGGGGHLEITQAYFPVGAHTVVVGAGGAAQSTVGDNYGLMGINGNTSRIGDFFAPGGGGGGGLTIDFPDIGLRSQSGQNGGSGGGASGFNTGSSRVAGNGLSPIGNNGGASANAAGGGGGGAGAVGGNASSVVGGNGGNGTASSITGSSVTRGGGGGGGAATGGSGGTGGGGAGGSATATAGGTNLGGGGGAIGNQSNVAGVAGGSGIVIVRVG